MYQDVESITLERVEEITEEWDLELDRSILPEDKLISDLGFSSVDFVQLFVAIEESVQQKLGFHDLIMVNGRYVDDLSVGEVALFVKGKLQAEPADQQTLPTPIANAATTDPLTSEQISCFRQAIPAPALPLPLVDKNPPAIFILCPSRSGSTLLRVMLAGNPQLFAPPELHLLSFETLTQRQQALSNEMNAHLLNGTIRAIMQIKDCSAAEAHGIMATFEQQNLPCSSFYRQLQQWIGDRILVDKTPSYAYHRNFLERAEATFSNALYIHLLRHPYGAIRSFEDAKLERLLPFMRSPEFTGRQYAELAWLVCQQNILAFLQQIPAHRRLQIKFEDLVGQPEPTLQQICTFLNVDFYPRMLEPYQEKHLRMTDGVEAVSKMSGDLKFHLHGQIDAGVADRWQQFYTEDFIGDETRRVAELLGYHVGS